MNPLISGWSRWSHSSDRHRSAFTLLELLSVIAIAGLLALATLPAFRSFSGSAGRRSAIAMVMSNCSRARALALASCAPHYLVFTNGNPLLPEYWQYRGCAIFQEIYDAEHQRYRFQLESQWTQLPTGICFDPASDTIFHGETAEFYCGPAGTGLALPFIRFNEQGMIDSSHGVFVLRIGETNRRFPDPGTIQISPVTGLAQYVEDEWKK